MVASAAAAAVPPVAAQAADGKKGEPMKVKHFLSAVEHDRIHDAIRAAEAGNSADIVLYVSRRSVEDALASANAEYAKLGLDKAKDKNSLLIFVAPVSQNFAVVGGPALHEKVGQRWWDMLVATLTAHFKKGDFTEGIVAAMEEAGVALREHFPCKSIDRAGQKDIVEE